MELFAGASRDFHYELVDLDRSPGRARRDGIDRYDRAVMRYRTQRVVVNTDREGAIAAGLLRLVRGADTTVFFLAGHGERALVDAVQPAGYGQVKRALEQESYVVETVRLVEGAEVPAGAGLLIICGPKSDLLVAESDAIERYLRSGGHVIAMIDPAPLPNLRQLVARYGIDSPPDVIVDPTNQLMGSDPFTVPVPTYQPHVITSVLRTPALFVIARPAIARAPPRGVRHTAVAAETYPDASAVRDPARGAAANGPSHGVADGKGPIPVVSTAILDGGDKDGGRLVVVGDSDFASNGFIDLLGNRDLFLSAVAWSVALEPLLLDPPAEVQVLRPLSPLVLSQRQSRLLFFAIVLAQPLAIALVAALVVLPRRFAG
jgi:ABC-type uncharacterized transport system involved in gliding motility auxiliary subunit